MWGLGPIPSLRKSQEKSVHTSDVPGFSKWFANEVYVESKLMDGAVEQISLSMTEHTEWLNSVMGNVMVLAGPDEKANGSVTSLHTLKEVQDDTVALPTTRESPEVVETREEEPVETIQEPAQRKESIISIETTTTRATAGTERGPARTPLTSSSPEAPEKKSEETGREPINVSDAKRDSDGSFEAISRNIRKSFAAKTMKDLTERQTLEPTERANHLSSSASPAKEADSSDNEELKKISRMMQEDSDELMLSDFEDDLGLGRLEKIELADIRVPLKDAEESSSSGKRTRLQSSATPLAADHPIKFAELPSREPLKVRSTRKKRSTMNGRSSHRQKRHRISRESSPTERLQQKAKNKTTQERKSVFETSFKTSLVRDPTSPSPFRDDLQTDVSRVSERKHFKLANPPHIFRSPAKEPEEPTISLTRADKRATVATTPKQKRQDALFERLSAKRKVHAVKAVSPKRAETTANRTPKSPIRSPARSPLRAEVLSPVRNPVRSPTRGQDPPRPSKTPVKIPLTEQSLKPLTQVKLLEAVSPSRRQRVDYQIHLRKQKAIEERRAALKRLRENHPRLNILADAEKTKVKVEPDLVDLSKPEKKEQPTQSADTTGSVAAWANAAELDAQLRRQATLNPSRIFGLVPRVECAEIFDKKYFSSLNIRWQDSDKLSQKEVDGYNRQMGYS